MMGDRSWDPNGHRAPVARMAEILGSLRHDERLALPDGIRVTAYNRLDGGRDFAVDEPAASEGSWLVDPVGRTEQLHRTADAAAQDALTRSARSPSPRSLGGPIEHASIAAAIA